jgi:hypothetical protein
MSTLTDRRKAALIIGGFVLFQSCFLAIFLRFGLRHFLVHLGFLAGKHAPRRDGYAAAAIVAVAFIAIALDFLRCGKTWYGFPGSNC